MGLSEKYINFINHPAVEATINFIKKFKPSKSYYSVSYFILLFTFREAIAWKYGSSIRVFCEQQALDSSFPIFWTVIGFILDVGGSWELVALGVFIFIILSLTKVSESEVVHNGSYLLPLFVALVGLFSSPLYYFIQGSEIAKTVKSTDEKVDKLMAGQENIKDLLGNKEKPKEVIQKNQKIFGVIKNNRGDKLQEVTIYLEKTKEEVRSNKYGEYQFDNVLGEINEETNIVLSKLGCDIEKVLVILGQRNDIIIDCNN